MNADVPLITPKPVQVPFGFSAPDRLVTADKIVLAKEPK